ncbi:hypothetical protein phiTE_029 [Pectobacterium phage phiTE]|uniref:Uncharacterized protein n=1 Tax=Pectobacterium phage phiTE TaxID=1116482 RepID=K9L510_9CAUD|nr:hypothetical protein phiTE_029 [Pectobacterium phage phiTE]AEZ66195.1 hypothetical protein phiTE_029 [Pectobacterium phage phiTE]
MTPTFVPDLLCASQHGEGHHDPDHVAPVGGSLIIYSDLQSSETLFDTSMAKQPPPRRRSSESERYIDPVLPEKKTDFSVIFVITAISNGLAPALPREKAMWSPTRASIPKQSLITTHLDISFETEEALAYRAVLAGKVDDDLIVIGVNRDYDALIPRTNPVEAVIFQVFWIEDNLFTYRYQFVAHTSPPKISGNVS